MTRQSISQNHPASATRQHRVCELRSGAVRFADRTVLADVDLVVGPHSRYAVIGDNGTGKSTLLNVLTGDVELSGGERVVDLPGGVSIARQHPEFAPEATINEALTVLLADLRCIEAELADTAEELSTATATEQDGLLRKLADLTDRFEARGGYGLDRRLDAALEQLGLADTDRTRLASSLSGGERARLALAAAVSAEAELLLLDEPTNDLDDAGIAWLEGQLARHRGALVIVSHDRAFIEKFAREILYIDGGDVRKYGNGYEGFRKSRAAQRQRATAEYEAWRQEVVRNERLVAANSFRLSAIPRKREKAGFGHGAFRARSGDHGTVGRIKQAKERVARLHADPARKPADPLHFSPRFEESPVEAGSTPLLSLCDVRLNAGAAPPRSSIKKLEVEPGDRWIISGKNGAGKTTLLRVIAGELTPQTGVIRRAPGLRIAWLRQDIVAGTRRSLLEVFAEATFADYEEAATLIMALGLFDPADFDRPVADLSIGQRRRLELCIAVSTPSDILLLDEPTNHLSPELVEQLEAVLREYPGAVFTVTHDRRWRQNAEASGGVRFIEVGMSGAAAEV